MADYKFYRENYFGSTIDMNDFPRLSARAEDIIVAFERDYTIAGDDTARKKAICALAEAVQVTDKAASAALSGEQVTSRSIGSVSVSYAASSPEKAGLDLSERATLRRYYDIARRYLDIRRGVR